MQSVLQEAEKKLQSFTTDNTKYKKMLTDLLVQALRKLKQPEALVKGRECDADLIKVTLSNSPILI